MENVLIEADFAAALNKLFAKAKKQGVGMDYAYAATQAVMAKHYPPVSPEDAAAMRQARKGA